MTAQLLKKLTLVGVMNFQYQIHIVYSVNLFYVLKVVKFLWRDFFTLSNNLFSLAGLVM